MWAGFTSGHKTFLSGDIQEIHLYFLYKIDSSLFQPVHLIVPLIEWVVIFSAATHFASLQILKKTNLVHVVMKQPTPDGTSVSWDALWLACWQAFPWLWRSPCLHLAFSPLPVQSLAEPAGWASPSAFSLVPLIFLFTILLLILEFTFLSKRFIGLLEFLAFLWQEIWAFQ